MDENIEVIAKLKLDTTEAEAKLANLAEKPAKVSKAAETAKKIQKEAKEAQNTLKEVFTGDKGLSNIGKLAKSATGGLNGVANTLASVTSNAGKAGLAISAVVAVVMILGKLLQGTDTMLAITSEFTRLFNSLRQTLAPVLSILGDIIISVVKIVKDILPVLSQAIDVLALGLKFLSDILVVLEPAIYLIGKTFEALYQIVRTIIKGITFGLVDLGRATGSTAVEKIAGQSSSLDIWETSGGTEGDKIQDGATTFETAVKELDTIFKKLFEGEGNFFTNLRDGIVSAAQSAWDATKNTASSVWNTIKDTMVGAWKGVAGFATNIWEGTKGIAKKIGGAVGGFFSNLKFWDAGGTLDLGAQVWGMNEKNNPEFIFNSGGYNSVINANALENAMYKALVKSGITDNKNVELKVGGNADARQLVKWLLPALKLEWGKS